MQGRIITNISNNYKVELDEKEDLIDCKARGILKEKKITPVVGDKVNIELTDSKNNVGIINDVIERKSYIKRPKMANLSKICLIVSMKFPKPDLLLLDKQLAFAEFNKLDVLIVLNKADLVDSTACSEIEKIYKDIGYDIIKTNAKDGAGIDALKEKLKNNISAFSGNSGVGKSTLINSIFNLGITKEGEISQKNKRGKNTTTSSYLYKLEEKTYIADTPGFSTFDISEIESKDLYKYFKEFSKYEKDCAFVGCTHIKEEQCGIKKAVANGKIESSRYDRFVKIYGELKEKEVKKW